MIFKHYILKKRQTLLIILSTFRIWRHNILQIFEGQKLESGSQVKHVINFLSAFKPHFDVIQKSNQLLV